MTNEAKFNFYINRQGIRGRKGEKGDTGFSPTVEVNTNTAAEYTLKIINEDGEFITDNLRGSAVEDRGGTYMRYDPETQEMYAGNPDSAATNQAGVVIIADQNSIENISGDTVLTPEGFVNNLKTFLKSSDNSVSITQDEEDSKTDLTVDLSGISGDISGLESRMTGCESAIDTIENTTIPAIQGDVDQLELDVADKVDKVAGKGLSTNDFTNEDNDKLMHAVVDEDLADVAFSGDYNDLDNKPTIPVIPANNLTGDSVDGTTIVYDSATGKISATAQTPDLSNYMTLNSAQNVSGTKYYEGDTLKVKNSTSGDYGNVAAYDNTIYPTTIENFSQAGGVMIGGLPNAGLKTLTAQWMTEYDSTLQDYRLAQIFNDYNLIGGTNVSIIQNPTTGLYEIVAHDTTYTEGNGIDINNANQISVKVDGASIVINNDGELEATAQTPDLSNYVDKTSSQAITGTKSFGTVTNFGTDNPITISANRAGANRFSSIKGSAPVNHLNTNSAGQVWGFDKDPVFTNGTTGGESSVPSNYQPYLRYGNITSTGGTISITNNGASGINLEAQGGAEIDDTTVSTDTVYSSDKTVDFVTGAIQDALDTVADEFVAKTDIATSAAAGIVKPDGSTITVAADGTISVAGGGGSSYSAGLGININANNEISVKNDRSNGIYFNANGELAVACDQATIGINSSGNLEILSAPAPSNMVTTNTTQTISGSKTFSASASNLTFSNGFNCGNSAGTPYFSVAKGGSYGSESTTLNVPSNFIIHPHGTGSTYGSVIIGGYKSSVGAPYYHNFYNSSNPYYPIAHAGNLTSTGGTVTITQNGAMINLEVAGGSSGGVQKVTDTNPALTPNASNQCTWSITNSLNTNEAIVQIYEVSTGVQITNADIYVTSSTITILLPSTVNINAGAYRVVIIG